MQLHVHMKLAANSERKETHLQGRGWEGGNLNGMRYSHTHTLCIFPYIHILIEKGENLA